MTRTVKVVLDADVAGFKAKLREGSAAVRDFRQETARAAVDFDRQMSAAASPDRFRRHTRGLVNEVVQETGSAAAGSLRDALSGIPAEAKTALTAGLVAGAVAASPVVGSLLGAGLLGGLGSGALGAGIAASLRSPAVKGAFAGLKAEAGSVADEIARDFQAPVVDGVSDLRSSLAVLKPEIRSALAPAAGYIDPLVDGVTGLVENALPGLADGIAAAEPIIDALATALPSIGDTVGTVFSDLGEHADQFSGALTASLATLEAAVSVGGTLVGVMGDVFEFALDQALVLSKAWDLVTPGKGSSELTKELTALALQTHGVADASADAAEDQSRLRTAADNSAAAIRGERDALSALSKQMRAEIDPAFGVIEAQRKLKESRLAVAEATKKYGRDSDQAREATRTLALAAVELEGQVGALGGSFDGKLSPALRATLRAAGMTAPEINAVAREFRNAKTAGDKFAKNYPASVSVNGLSKADGQIAALRASLAGLTGRPYTISVRAQIPQGLSAAAIEHYNATRGRARGGVDYAMAAGGIAQVYPAGAAPLIKFAEPETGGEGYIPKNGSRARNLAIMGEIASWPSVNAAIIPMAAGGIHGAASRLPGGLTHTIRSAPPERATRIEWDDAYLSARDAVRGFSAALKENGRQLSTHTAKGRENRKAFNDAVTAAREAARVRYEETGSVKLANRAYDEQISRLKAVLRQHHVTADGIRRLMSRTAGSRPTFGTGAAAPRDSSRNIAYIKDKIGLADATAEAGTFFAADWGVPTWSTNTPQGRDSLNALFSYLGAAGAAARSRFAQTGSVKLATSQYNASLRSIKQILMGAGVKAGTVDQLLRSYGRITFDATANATGGLYERAATGVLRDSELAAAGATRYAWAEPSTGGELFAPRYGNAAKTQANVTHAVRNWWGGDVTWGGRNRPQPAAGEMTIRIVVQDGQVQGLVHATVDRVMGALADAHIYATAS